MTNKQFLKRFDEIKKRLSKDRDDLRDLLDEATSVIDVSNRAVDAIEEAEYSLSELL